MIDFGLSTCPTSERRKKRDFDALDQTFKRGSYDVHEGNEDNMEVSNAEKTDTKNNKYGSGGNDMITSSKEGSFGRVSEKSQATGLTKRVISSTSQRENKEND